MYRRALLYDKIGDTDKAKTDLINAAKSDPKSIEIRRQLKSIINKMKKIQKLSDISWKEKLTKTFETSTQPTNISLEENKSGFCQKLYSFIFGSNSTKLKSA